MNRLFKIFLGWLPLGIAIIGLAGLTYVVTQQNYRSNLNDPQVQMAEDGAIALASGTAPISIIPRGTRVDITKSLIPFIAVYDKDYTLLESSGVLDSKPLQPPKGVFVYAQKYGENRVTWQPEEATRVALVVKSVHDGSGRFVAAGRNMREVETRISHLGVLVGVGLISILIISFALFVVVKIGLL